MDAQVRKLDFPLALRPGDALKFRGKTGTLRVNEKTGWPSFIPEEPRRSVLVEVTAQDVLDIEGCGKFRGYHLRGA